MSEGAFRKYTVDSPAMKMDVENKIRRLEEWALVKDVGVIFPPLSFWEVWVAGELKNTVSNEREAEAELRKYLNRE